MKTLVKTIPFKGDALRIFRLFKDRRLCFFFDSSSHRPSLGRFSFIGFDPFAVVNGENLRDWEGLKKKFASFEVPATPLPFESGIAGFISYDFGLSMQNVSAPGQGRTLVPQFLFGFYDCVITIDHREGKIIISSTGLPEKDPLRRKRKARQRLDEIAGLIQQGLKTPEFKKTPKKRNTRFSLQLKSDFTKQQYIVAIRRALDHIRRGDIYQVNLSHRLRLDVPTLNKDLFAAYEILRRKSPNSFGAYLDGGKFKILSSSPELFLRLKKGIVETRPMKGTRPRGRTRKEDLALREELLKSPKEIAELLMITDLERNDLGRVCTFGSVKVKQMRTIESYSTVFQATSSIEGKLQKGKNGFDVLEASFPGGSVTGCPKLRAMSVIHELEKNPRDIYTGSMGFMSFSGDMEFNVLIRTLLWKEGKVYFHVGGGIVADSKPESEYEETWVKARAMVDTLKEIL